MTYTRAYIRWYYGYKNFGDELLLLGLMIYLHNTYNITSFVIHTKHQQRLKEFWCNHTLEWYHLASSTRFPLVLPKQSLLVLWWWEVLTDARPFPYNWRTTLFFHSIHCMTSPYLIVWWIGTIKKLWTSFLYKVLLWRAISVVVRDTHSYSIAKKYSDNVQLLHDFAFEYLKSASVPWLDQTPADTYVILNINTHIRNHQTRAQVSDRCNTYTSSSIPIYFFPASVGTDDSDLSLYSELLQIDSTIQLRDRTRFSISKTYALFLWATEVVAARLHVVLMALRCNVPVTPLIYQEKVSRLIKYYTTLDFDPPT